MGRSHRAAEGGEMKTILVLLAVSLLVGCASQQTQTFWSRFAGEDEFYIWDCFYQPDKKTSEKAWGEHFEAKCHRHLKPPGWK